MPNKITPMLKQYLAIKQQYADALLFYRMGDFYEMFFEDAHIASELLEIALTSRNKNDAEPVPMCGVPYRAAQGYIARLIEKGHKVAICDQVEDAALAKGLVKREVVQVITPGMILDDGLLKEKQHNFVLALAYDRDAFGVASLDVSTGAFRVCESDDAGQVAEEIQRIGPSEILLPAGCEVNFPPNAVQTAIANRFISYIDDVHFRSGNAQDRLLRHFNTLNLQGFGCDNLKMGLPAAGALLHYIIETQKRDVSHVRRLERYYLNQYMIIDDTSCRNLEILSNIQGQTRGSLVNVLDCTCTAMGGRLFRHWLRYPLIDIARIQTRLDAVDEARQHIQDIDALRADLKQVYDLERLMARVAMGHGNARDLIALKQSLRCLPPIAAALENWQSALFGDCQSIRQPELAAAGDIIDSAIDDEPPPGLHDGGLIKSGFSQEVDELISITRDGKSWLLKLERDERQQTGIQTLKVRFNKVFGYYLEVPKARAADVPAHYVRKQTLVNAERYITDALKTFEARVTHAEAERARLEFDLFNAVCKQVLAHAEAIAQAARFVARLDCLLALALVAARNDYVRPHINRQGRIHIEEGRHPVIEKLIVAERFVPNSIQMNMRDSQVLIITGPNMAGKSTILRQVALSLLMMQMGGFVPAASADLMIVDRIFTRVGALDNLSAGQSTFMVEMQETANILNNATEQSLIVMDEIGRGTSTFDGLSIAWAVAEYLHDLHNTGVMTLFATHYHELTELAKRKARVKNFNIAVKEWKDDIIFLRKLVPGATNRSYGIQVARLAGVPRPVIERANAVLAKIENANGQNHVAALTQPQARPPKQLRLFRQADDALMDRLKSLDVTQLTPLEALNELNELQQMAC